MSVFSASAKLFILQTYPSLVRMLCFLF